MKSLSKLDDANTHLIMDLTVLSLLDKCPYPEITKCFQIYQQDIIARNFIDGFGKKQIYQVISVTEL